jgi:hypothetical protein
MFRFNHHHVRNEGLIPNSAPHTHTHTHTNMDLIKYADTPTNQPQRCILTEYFLTITFASSNNPLPDVGD